MLTEIDSRPLSQVKILPLLLLVIPGALLGSAIVAYRLLLPIYSNGDYDYDPSYQYLLNGLSVIQGYVPGHIDHPGTPVQVLCGIVAAVLWLLARLTGGTTLDLNTAVVTDIELYLSGIAYFFAAMNAAAIGYVGWRVYRASGDLLIAIVCQAGFLLLGYLLPRLIYVSPEALMIFAAAMLMACLADVLFGRHVRTQRQDLGVAVVSGFLLALGITSKATFLPLILLLAILPTRRDRVAGTLSFLTFMAVFLAPIYSKLSYVLHWYSNIARHSGKYGQGPSEFIDFLLLPARLHALLDQLPLIFVSSCACILVLTLEIIRSSKKGDILCRDVLTTCVLFLVFLSGLVLVLKHYEIYYIIPSYVVSSIAFAWCLTRLFPDRGKWLHFSPRAIAAIFMIALGAQQISTVLNDLSLQKRQREADLALLQNTLDANEDALVIGAYRSRTQTFGIAFALGYVDQKFAALVSAGHQPYVQINRWNMKLFWPGVGWRPLSYVNELITQGRNVLVVLPDDLNVPEIQGPIVCHIPGAERVIKVIKIDEG
jgi:hypothetical protein